MLAITASNLLSPLNHSHPSLWISGLRPAPTLCALCVQAPTKAQKRHHIWKKTIMLTSNYQVKYLAQMIFNEKRFGKHSLPVLKIFYRFISGAPNKGLDLNNLRCEKPRSFDSGQEGLISLCTSNWTAETEKFKMSKMGSKNGQKMLKGLDGQFPQSHTEVLSSNNIHLMFDSEGRSNMSIVSSVNDVNKSTELCNVNGGIRKRPSAAVPSLQHLDALCRRDLPLNWQLHGEKAKAGEQNDADKQKSVEPSSCYITADTDVQKSVEQLSCCATSHSTSVQTAKKLKADIREALSKIYDKVLVVDSISMAKEIAERITMQYGHLIHACDTEVSEIDVKDETPVDHGELICFSIYSGPEADYGDGKSLIWVDTLDGDGKDTLLQFKPFFEDPSIRKVWHNYSFDNHIIQNYGIKLSGFHADTMHMARLLDSSRGMAGGYSLEALTTDAKIMSCAVTEGSTNVGSHMVGKVSMKTIFARQKTKKDGSEGKASVLDPVENLQRDDRKHWICYSAVDSMSTLKLYVSLEQKLSARMWQWQPRVGKTGTMFDFYETFWRPFGELLVKMETDGMLVDRIYLSEIEKVARAEKQAATNKFRSWASTYCPDAMYMNVGSDTQLRQLFFGGMVNRMNPDEMIPCERTFRVPDVDEEGNRIPRKNRNITLRRISHSYVECDLYTKSGKPSVSADSLRTLAGKVSENESTGVNAIDAPSYGYAYTAFGGGHEGAMACHAIDAFCKICSIDSLISNFILPLQGSGISGKDERVHCSLNINTETGRLSARRPNLQNQPALEKDRYKIRKAFIAAPGNSLIVADYGQLELRLLAHLADCKSMLAAFKAGGDFHSRTAINMYPHIREAVDEGKVFLEWNGHSGDDKPPVPLLKDVFTSERRKAKMLNFSIAYGKTPAGLAKDWKVSVKEARRTVDLWYNDRQEVLKWQKAQKESVFKQNCIYTLLGRSRVFPCVKNATNAQRNHIERAAINAPVQGSAADVAMCAMLRISRDDCLKQLGWKLLLQIHDEVILEGPSESAEIARSIVVECMSKPFRDSENILKVDLAVDAKIVPDWYSAK